MPPKVAKTPSPSWEEMESKRKEMVKSLQSLSEAMQSCASIIQDYVSYSPENITDTHEKKRKADAELNGKAKKVKKVKDPNEPKRPPSAYLAYQNSVREELKKASPDISNAALMGMISEKWKAMTPDERKPYDEHYKNLSDLWKANKVTYDADQVAAADTAAAKPLDTASTVAGSDSESDDTESEKTDDDDDSDDSSDDEEPAAPVPAPPAKKERKNAKAAPAPVPAPAPPTPSKVAASKEKTKEKKEKKSKPASPEKAKKAKGKKTA